MATPAYAILSHAEALSQAAARGENVDLLSSLDQLSRAAFGQYDGTIVGTPALKRWFTSRPGMTDSSRFVATTGGQAVSSVFVTITPMQWKGEVVTAGLIDSVMTHPAHRRRGLAKTLLARATDFMAEGGVDLSLLYTVADSMPYELYASLGFVDYLRVHLLERPDGGGSTASPDAARLGSEELRNLLDRAFSRHDGYLPMSEALWQWRRERRPASAPVQMHTSCSGNDVRAIYAIGSAPIRTAGKPAQKAFLNDYAALDGQLDADLCLRMVRAATPAIPVMTACPDTNEADLAALAASGFESIAEESCMIKPLTSRAEQALCKRPELWYAVTETIVGI